MPTPFLPVAPVGPESLVAGCAADTLAAAGGFATLARLGAEHAARGVDLLLFLLAAATTAPLQPERGRWLGPVDVATTGLRLLGFLLAFASGQVAVLAAAALGWTGGASRVPALAVALLVLVRAVHTVVPLPSPVAAVGSALFGLSHGLAEAQSLGVSGGEREPGVLALLALVLGIQAFLVLATALTAPWLFLLASTRAHALPRVLIGLWLGVAGLAWCAERGFGWTNPLGPVLACVGARFHWVVVAVGALALGAHAADAVRQKR